MTPPTNPYRLPRALSPQSYTLTLEPDLAAATFTGQVIIECVVNEPTAEIVLNAAELDITSVKVDGDDAGHRLDEATQRLFIDAAVDGGSAVVEIHFAGTLNDKLRGWYRSTYRDESGTEHVIATTQMQATDCRRAFPCFDEPDFKSTFEITLVIEDGLLAVSNGPEIGRTTEGGKVHVRFAPTMPMSTYLVAFVVGPLEATEAIEVERLGGGTIPLRIIHVPGKAHLTGFATEIGAFSLRWFQEYYDIEYPTEKCDLLALPDFAAGAMENLGCITFRENLLLVDPATATQVEMQTLADVVAHELAHMWFGDLVTMRWWNGIWLNEAFATFMEIAACDAFRPDWQRWTTFSLERSMAFDVDSLASTRPIEFPVEAPEDAEGMFDLLTYQKGGSLLRMLEQYLGVDQFRAGVSHYLRNHEYGNTETEDLWNALEEVNPDTPVRAMMDSWIWQPGYPLIHARLDGTDLVLTQQRFSYGADHDDTLFVVPLHLRIDGVDSKVLLDGAETRVPLVSADAAVVVNAGGHGFVRVAYDEVLRQRVLHGALGSLSTIDRYNLIDDARNELLAGRMEAIRFFDFVTGFAAESDLAVWQAIAGGLAMVSRLVDGDALRTLRRRIAEFVHPPLELLGWVPQAGEDELTAKRRGVMLTLLGVTAADQRAIEFCRGVLDGSAEAAATADPELVAAATSVVASAGTEADYERFLAGFRAPATPQDQLRYMYALADFPDERHVARTLELAFSGEVKTQNAPFLLARAIGNRFNGVLAWRVVRDRWDEANRKFPSNTIVRMITPVRVLTDPDVVDEVQRFFAEHPIPQATKTLDQVLESQRVHAALAEREAERLSAALHA